MQEIAPYVYIFTKFLGVTTSVITFARDHFLIDAPFHPDDLRSWKDSLQTLGNVPNRSLISLDEHMDRTLGSRQVDCMVIAQEKIIQLFKDRPTTIKPQVPETGAEWEFRSVSGNVRWLPPEITFSDSLELHSDNRTMLLIHRPGPSTCAIWVVLPSEKVVFAGDLIMPGLPPFLANANLTQWRETLALLLNTEYRDYHIISGRTGEVTTRDIKTQLKILEKIESQVEKLSSHQPSREEINKASQSLLRQFDVPSNREQQYTLRLRWGLTQYMRRQYGINTEPVEQS